MPILRIALYLTAFAIWCWLAMMLTHELGHVLAAWATGGRLVYVNVYPGYLSSTLVSPNPAPGIVLWSGFASGWLAPQAIALVLRRQKSLAAPAACWAGFCWLANGVYLAAGGMERLTDTGQLAREGWPLWLLIAIGTTTAVLGYAICRRAWQALVRDVNDTPPSWKKVGAAYAGLAVWIALQWALAEHVLEFSL